MMVTDSGITVVLHPEISVFVDVSIMALQPLRLSYTLLPASTMTEDRLLQPEKTPAPILVTDAGIMGGQTAATSKGPSAYAGD